MRSYERQNFPGRGHSLGRFSRKQKGTIQAHVQSSRWTNPYLRYNAQFAINFLFQAHGLLANVGSHEAALNFNFHRLNSTLGKYF
jgi:hypothetical protein